MASNTDPLWYKTAVIYELHVRAFCDSDADGVGDFRGLTSRLDYLQSLGVTAIWLLPFYPSPLRDDGYDIADYTAVNPAYGTLDDFREFVQQAHQRNLRVITELVINHTSDQHPWFQRARKAPLGSVERDFYVWSDTTDRYREARIIFQDFESSNWAWDETAGSYYWHRFYHHQPDLNFDNPAVHEAVFDVMDFWFELGVDGMRLDAVPYVYEREGTNCENLPETHAFLRKLRARLDQKYDDKMLLAEANQWPEDAAEYFGDGDECHMNFHFPLMPRLFMAVRMEDRFPIVDILEQTPELPDHSQWAIFLRNHDELTLEMVTDEERDYMYRSYAADRQARVNLGIRRRLAPLLDNNRRKIELLNGLLLSLPGSPVLYYGDEIGMGDNYYLGDRDAVRTPMQWSSDRNAGFSRANPQRLFLPVIIDPEYHYETVNVETQLSTASSLLWWTRRIIGLRKQHPVFGMGSMRLLQPDNPKVLAFLREHDDERVLVVANLSRFTQPATIDLTEFAGYTPIEMFGGAPFPQVRDSPYSFTMSPHSFVWLALQASEKIEAQRADDTTGPAELHTDDDPTSWLTSQAARRWYASHLADNLNQQPWFAHQTRSVRDIEVIDSVPIPMRRHDAPSAAAIMIVSVRFSGSEWGAFAATLALATPQYLSSTNADPDSVLARVSHASHRSERVLFDAATDPCVAAAVYDMVRTQAETRGYAGRMVGRMLDGFDLPAADDLPSPAPLARRFLRQSSVHFGDDYVLKMICRDRPANGNALELARHLTEFTEFCNAPKARGWLDYITQDRKRFPLALVRTFTPHQTHASEQVRDELSRYFDDLFAHASNHLETPDIPLVPLAALIDRDSPADAHELFGRYLESAQALGARVAELHGALADSSRDPEFEPEPFTTLKQRAAYQSMRNAALPTLQMLKEACPSLDPDTRRLVEELIAREDEMLAQFELLSKHRLDTVRIRCHGHLTLETILWTGRDYVFTDFEGDPAGRLAELRLKHCSLVDVATLLLDFNKASTTTVTDQIGAGALMHETPGPDRLLNWAAYWYTWVGAALLGAYVRRARQLRPGLVPPEDDALVCLFHAKLLDRTLADVRLTLIRQPNDIGLAVRRVLRLLTVGHGL
jgi:maltose alpha-D-glucosyltransferase/alpha-amylase